MTNDLGLSSEDRAAYEEVVKAGYHYDKILGSQRTTMKIGGPVFHFFEIQDEQKLPKLLRELASRNLKARVLGAGSNLIIPTAGMGEAVLGLSKKFDYIKNLDESRVEVGAATMLPTLSLKLCQAGLAGLAFAAGIPGTLGGGMRMNCGAHGHEIAEILEELRTYSLEDGTHRTYKRDELAIGYRSISIPHNTIITSAILRMRRDDVAAILEDRQKCLSYRKQTQPLTVPSAGSVFRNPAIDPVKLLQETKSAGALIEKTGLKGMCIGGAEISSLHANWIVNPKREATSDDVRTLVNVCQAKVAQEYSIKLITEIIFW